MCMNVSFGWCMTGCMSLGMIDYCYVLLFSCSVCYPCVSCFVYILCSLVLVSLVYCLVLHCLSPCLVVPLPFTVSPVPIFAVLFP